MKKTLLMAVLMSFAISTFAQSNMVSHETKKKPKKEHHDKKKKDKHHKKDGK